MRYSVVIPCYNCEKYIEGVVTFLQNCRRKGDLEIFLVNDGSTDSTLQVINEVSKIYSNIIVINQSNKGCAEARNAGLRSAKGDYVFFLDADDLLDEEFFLRVESKIEENFPDVIVFGHKSEVSRGKWIEVVPYGGEDRVYGGLEYLESQADDLGRIDKLMTVWSFFYKKSFLDENDLDFLPVRYSEDLHFSLKSLLHAKSVVVINFPIYLYRYTENSITKGVQDFSMVLDRMVVGIRVMGLISKMFNDVPSLKPSLLFSVNRLVEETILRSVRTLRKAANDDCLHREILVNSLIENNVGFLLVQHATRKTRYLRGWVLKYFPIIYLRFFAR